MYNSNQERDDDMDSNASLADVLAFLAQVKRLLAAGQYDFVPRRKNLMSLAACGLTIKDAKDEILGLTASDYYKGPKQDLDAKQPGDIWEFKKKIGSKQFYVKLKIQNRNGTEILKCLSFHEDDFC